MFRGKKGKNRGKIKKGPEGPNINAAVEAKSNELTHYSISFLGGGAMSYTCMAW